MLCGPMSLGAYQQLSFSMAAITQTVIKSTFMSNGLPPRSSSKANIAIVCKILLPLFQYVPIKDIDVQLQLIHQNSIDLQHQNCIHFKNGSFRDCWHSFSTVRLQTWIQSLQTSSVSVYQIRLYLSWHIHQTILQCAVIANKIIPHV